MYASFLCFGLFAAKKALAETIELKMSHFLSTQHVQHAKVMAPWAKDIEALSGGRLKVTIFSDGAQGKPSHQYDNAVRGITDIAFGLQSDTAGRFPLTAVMRLPFMVKSGQQGSAVLWKLYEEYLQDEYKDVKVLWLFMDAPGQFHTTQKQVRTLEDLDKLKIRSPGPIMSDVIKTFGAVPVHIPVAQVHKALERKTVDGVAAPWADMRLSRFYEQCKYSVGGNIYSMTFFVVMNRDKYESLPADLKKIIDHSSGLKMSLKAGKAYDDEDRFGRELFEKKGGIVYQLPAAEIEKWMKAVAAIKFKWVNNTEVKGLPGKEVFSYVHKKLRRQR